MVSYGTFTNTGVIDVVSISNNGGNLTNSGTLSSAQIANSGTFNNSGAVTGNINNSGTFNNSASLYGGMNNAGILNNHGAIINNKAFTNAGTFVNSGSVQGSGTFSQTAGTSQINGAFAQSAMNLQGGSMFGTGTITSVVTNTGATIQGGSAGIAGTLTISGSLTQGSGGTIQELISGTSTDQYSHITINGSAGTAALDGILNITTGDSFSFAAGDIFSILETTGGITGTFAQLDFDGFIGNGSFVDIGDNLVIDADYSTNGVTLDVVRAPEIDPSFAASGFALLLGGLAAFRGRRRSRWPSDNN